MTAVKEARWMLNRVCISDWTISQSWLHTHTHTHKCIFTWLSRCTQIPRKWYRLWSEQQFFLHTRSKRNQFDSNATKSTELNGSFSRFTCSLQVTSGLFTSLMRKNGAAFDQRTTELSAWSSRKCWHDKAANHRKKNTNHRVNKKYNNGYASKKKKRIWE